MSTEVEWGNWEPSKAKPNFTFSEMADQEYDRYNKAEKLSAYTEGVIGAYDRRNDDVFKATGEKLFNPLRDIPDNDSLAEMQAAYREHVGAGNVDTSRAVFQQEWFASKYDRRLKEIQDRYPQHGGVIKSDRSPVLDHAEIAQAAERKSADIAERLGMVDVRDGRPGLKYVPVLPDIANLVANTATNPTATVAQFWGGFKAQMQDPVEATMNLLGFGAGKASMSVLKTALLNAGANAAIEAAAQPMRQYNRKELGLEYGWERALADISGAAATGALLDAGVRIPYRAAVTRFGKDAPAGEMFSKHGRGGILTDAIEQTTPITPIVREQITPAELEKAQAGDLDAIEAIAKKTGAIDDLGVKGALDYAKLGGKIDDAMVEKFKAMGVDHGEMMATLKAAIDIGGKGYVRVPDPIPQAKAPLDTAGAAELAPRLQEIEQRLAEAPQEVRQAVLSGVATGIPEIVQAARAALSGDLEGMRKAVADAGGEQIVADRVTVHTSTNPIAVARALRRSPDVMDSTVPMRSDFMRMARAISKLDDAAFEMLLRGEAHPMAGHIVADNVPPGQHAEVLRQVSKFRDIDEARAAVSDLVREPSQVSEPDAGIRVSDPSGPEAKAQVDALEKAHAKEVEAATAPIKKREELESKVETLKGEIAKLEEAADGKSSAAIEQQQRLVDKINKDLAVFDDMAAVKRKYKSPEAASKAEDRLSTMAAAEADHLKMLKEKHASQSSDDLATKRQELRQAERDLEAVQAEQSVTLNDPALYRMVMDRTAVQRRLDVRRAIDDALRLGDRVLPENTKVDVRADEMVDTASGNLLDASSDVASGDIALATYAMNPAGRMGHEAVHTLVTRGHISPEEITLLAQMARERGLFPNEARYRDAYAGRDNLDALINEEAAAHAIEARINGTDIGPANTMADRIKQIIERIRNALDGYGFKTADDVARAIINGEAAQRTASVEWMRNADITAASVKDGKVYAFGGERAKTADRDALSRAKSMADAGEDRTKIWNDTGWFRGVDGKWRFEINDSAAALNRRLVNDIADGKLDDAEAASVLDHPDLYTAYPAFAAMTTQVRKGTADGSFGASVIEVGDRETKPTMLHELQHATQGEEGFARGGNPLMFTAEQIAAERQRLSSSQASPSGWDAIDTLPSPREMSDRQVGWHIYQRIAGEVESRTVEKRQNMTPEERRARPPWLDYDVPEAEQIVRFNDAINQAIRDGSEEPTRLFALSDVSTGRSMRADLDKLGYYSKALEAAKAIPQAKGTPEQMLAALKKAGVKDAEIEATGLRQWLAEKSAAPEIRTAYKVNGTVYDLPGLATHTDVMGSAIDKMGFKTAAESNKWIGTAETQSGFTVGGKFIGKAEAAEKLGMAPYELDSQSQNVSRLLELFPKANSITRDDLVKHLTDNRVGLREVRRGDADPAVLEKAAQQEFGKSWGDLRSSDQSDIRARLEDHNGLSLGKWSHYSLDPSNPSYRETVLHLPDGRESQELKKLRDKIGGSREHQNYQLQDSNEFHTLPRGGMLEDFQSGHFSEPNIVGHMMTSLNKHEGKPVYTLDQIQSDWGQKLRDGGVRDEAKIAELRRQKDEAGATSTRILDQEVDKLGIADADQRHTVRGEMHAKMLRGLDSEAAREYAAHHHDYVRLNAEIGTAEASSPGHPLVNTTDQWTNTTLRRALRQAVEADAAFIAIPHGDTVLSYNPGDDAGMKGFYGSRTSEGIVPKNLRKLIEKLDPQAPRPVKIETLETPSGPRGWKENGERNSDKSQTGFTLFPLTEKVKRSVKEDGHAMFALSEYRKGRNVEDPSSLWFWQQPKQSGTSLLFHATNRSFDKFDLGKSSDFGIHFGSAKQAATRLADTRRMDGGRTIPVEVEVRNAIKMDDPGFWGPMEIAGELQKNGYRVSEDEWKQFGALADAIDQADADVQRIGDSVKPRLASAVNAANDAIKAKLNDLGIDGIWYRNQAEGRGWSLAVWNEGQVKNALTQEQMFALRDAPPIDSLKTDMAIVDRMNTLKELIEACR